MIEFEEPQDRYDFDEIKKKGNRVKIRIASMIIIFLVMIMMLVKNDYKFNFFETNLVPINKQCNPMYIYSPEDSQAILAMNAEQILNENVMEFGKLEGFSRGYVIGGVISNSEKEQKPQICLEFDGLVEYKKAIPEELCGFKISVVYK